MRIIDVSISNLIPYENNPRLNAEAVGKVAASIKEFGFKVPLVIDANNVIVCGHTRYKAAKELGLASVPCVVADDLTEEQIKAYRLADNKVAEFAKWDFEALEFELNMEYPNDYRHNRHAALKEAVLNELKERKELNGSGS